MKYHFTPRTGECGEINRVHKHILPINKCYGSGQLFKDSSWWKRNINLIKHNVTNVKPLNVHNGVILLANGFFVISVAVFCEFIFLVTCVKAFACKVMNFHTVMTKDLIYFFHRSPSDFQVKTDDFLWSQIMDNMAKENDI